MMTHRIPTRSLFRVPSRAMFRAPSFSRLVRKGWDSTGSGYPAPSLPCSLAPRKPVPSSETGYALLLAVFLTTLVVISLSVAVPKVVKSLQRDRDLETYHRGMQYRRAIQLYYRKFHAYPPNLDALVNTNDIRFLRKKYIDPSTGKDDWTPVLFGQNKTPTAIGFFGQVLSGGATSIAGIGPSGGNAPASASGGNSGTFGNNSGSFGGNSGSFGGNSGVFGSSGSSNNSTFGSSTTSSFGSTSSTSAFGSTGSTSGSNGTSGTGTSSNQSGQTFGGAGIIGFSPASPKQSIRIYKKKDHYNEWEFTYDPISEPATASGGNTGAIGQPAGSTSSPVGSSPFGNSSFGNPGIGGSGSTGVSSSPIPAAPQPTSNQ